MAQTPAGPGSSRNRSGLHRISYRHHDHGRSEEDFNPWMTRGTPVTFQVGPDTAMDPDMFFHGRELPAKDVRVNLDFRGQGENNIAIDIHFCESEGTCLSAGPPPSTEPG